MGLAFVSSLLESALEFNLNLLLCRFGISAFIKKKKKKCV